MHKEKIIVDEMVEKYKTANPFEMCDKININILYMQLGDLRGFYRYSKRNKFITINIDCDAPQKFITCAHELFHSMYHFEANKIFLDSTLLVSNKYENEADRFAAYLYLKHYVTYENMPIKYVRLINERR